MQVNVHEAKTQLSRRQGGQWKGRVKIHDDFDELPDDIAEAFGMLVAQARHERLTLVTSDPVFGRYDVGLMPASP